MKLKIGYLYPKELNLYGDNGNIEILKYRAEKRNILVEVIHIDKNTNKNLTELGINIMFMGGGPDSSQKFVYKDLVLNKKNYLSDYVGNDGVGLYICGAYQLFGNYYEAADGSRLQGLGIFDLYTKHFGNNKPRCIGNTYSELIPEFRHDYYFNLVNKVGSEIVGFENHGGRTYLGSTMLPLAKVIKGFGNNSEDGFEGVLYKSSIGTYYHGPFLSKNPHIADYLIAKSLRIDDLTSLDDDLILKAHNLSKKLAQ